MSLHDDQPLDLKDKRIIERSLHVPGWWPGLPENTKRAVMNKLLAALAKADSARDIGTLARALIAAERNDIEREKMTAESIETVVNHNTLNVTAGDFREWIKGNAATTEPTD